ncbi:hypothetical protein PPERSA_08124 [Pseudocohnilembus persalinus]|uniref:Cation/H+ exchanger transmembrane domain-containing protein n=1 Tax=Pseudocohnilembus persalinus TaxID=266149 RepID=A0A0V0QL27_PSEPJ|nr:hypothetical protein PPERSA_08124 [Pseudocohnilembus persalinus]|eukprot:KRX03049.1 hypothetical protein PPERSA_08124 [Pseudocohnilembus persalinus]
MGESNDIYVMVTVTIIILYMIFQAVIENKKIHIIHETGLGIILGIIFGIVLMEEHNITNFNGSFFFTYILPPIIFAAGYNLKKDKFFKNLSYISIYAVLGTIVNFAVTLGLMILFNKAWFYTIDGDQIIMKDSNILYFASTMCASDAIAAVTLINGEKYPRLFSIVFGEGLLNDAVSIILFHSVAQIAQGDDTSLDGQQILKMIWSFVTTCILSVLIGFIVGIFVVYLFKKCRMFYHNAVCENVLILMFGYLTYMIAEALGQSGVIAMLTCGLLMSHYLVYNLSPTGVISSGVTLQAIAQVAEAFLFIYLGITFWSYFGPNTYQKTSLSFIGLGFSSVIVARVFCIWATSGLFYIINRKSWKLTAYEISIVWFAGLIRGAVAFALIQTVVNTCKEGDENCLVQDQILKSSIMMIVLITTIVLGALMPCYLKIHLKAMEKKQAASPENEALLQDNDEEADDQNINDPEEIQKKFDEQKKKELKKKYKNSCIRFVKIFDEKVIKPFLIYNYKQRKIEINNQKKVIRENIQPSDLQSNVRTLARLQNELFTKSNMDSSFLGQSFAGFNSRIENNKTQKQIDEDDAEFQKLMMKDKNINNITQTDNNVSQDTQKLNE